MHTVDWQAERETLVKTAGESGLPTSKLRKLANRWQEVNHCGCPHWVEMLWSFWLHFPSLFMPLLNHARPVTIDESSRISVLLIPEAEQESQCKVNSPSSH